MVKAFDGRIASATNYLVDYSISTEGRVTLWIGGRPDVLKISMTLEQFEYVGEAIVKAAKTAKED